MENDWFVVDISYIYRDYYVYGYDYDENNVDGCKRKKKEDIHKPNSKTTR